MFAKAKTIRLEITESLADLATTDQSILAKAFRGELVEQASADEPASALLETHSGGTQRLTVWCRIPSQSLELGTRP